MHPEINRSSFDRSANQPPSDLHTSPKVTSKSASTTPISSNHTNSSAKASPQVFASELEDCIAAIVHKTNATTEFFEQISRPAALMTAMPPDFYHEPTHVASSSSSLPSDMAQSMDQLDQRINGVEADLQELRLRISSVLERL